MKQQDKDKELLLKDLCARLPYGVKVSCIGDSNHVYNLELIDITDNEVYISTYEPCYSNKYTNIESIRPYLFPLSSMTEEQREKLHELWDSNMSAALDCAIYGDELKRGLHQLTAAKKVNEWCYENHLDINNLITNRLAIDATGLNIY